MKHYYTAEKLIGETPLQALEKFRQQNNIDSTVPMAYAGRLDPMASGTLLILAGEECKKQAQYHSLDKEYEFSVLFGIASDTGDVLGILNFEKQDVMPSEKQIGNVVTRFAGQTIEALYPAFSSKTIQGKPLHVWTLEGRLDEIEIPKTQIRIHSLKCTSVEIEHINTIYKNALIKINSIPEVTEESKALGNDFRRKDVRLSWKTLKEMRPDAMFTIAHFTCICGSGSYMRTLAEKIGIELEINALAYSIHRTKIGTYQKMPFNFGYWKKIL